MPDDRPTDLRSEAERSVLGAQFGSQTREGSRADGPVTAISQGEGDVDVAPAVMRLTLGDVSAAASGEIADAQHEAGVLSRDMASQALDKMDETVGSVAISSLDSGRKDGEPSAPPRQLEIALDRAVPGVSRGHRLR